MNNASFQLNDIDEGHNMAESDPYGSSFLEMSNEFQAEITRRSVFGFHDRVFSFHFIKVRWRLAVYAHGINFPESVCIDLLKFRNISSSFCGLNLKSTPLCKLGFWARCFCPKAENEVLI